MDCSCEWCDLTHKCKRQYEGAECAYQYVNNEGEKVADVSVVYSFLQKAIDELSGTNLDDYCTQIRAIMGQIEWDFNDELKKEWEELNSESETTM